ncbi:MAG: hypothetical protein J6V76_01795 [Bacteroidales bacterium]|nr:hypothetical protein [Bacteroidales bacterium]
MKKLLTYTAFAAMMLTACAPDEHEDINIAARPSASDISVDYKMLDSNKVQFNLLNTGCNPIWYFDDNTQSTVNGFIKQFPVAGTYTVEIKMYNHHGICDGSIVKEFSFDQSFLDFGERKKFDGTNLWTNEVEITKYYATTGDWKDITDQLSISQNKEIFTVDAPTANVEKWQTQVHLHSNISSSADKNYLFRVSMVANAKHDNVTIKLTDDADDKNFIFANEGKYKLKANKPETFEIIAKGVDAAKLNLVFDFGGQPEEFNVFIYDIVLAEYDGEIPEEKPEPVAVFEENPDGDILDDVASSWKTTTYHGDAGWGEMGDWTITPGGYNYTIHYTNASDGQWKAQFRLISQYLTEAGQKYDIRVKVKSDKDIPQATFKVVSVDEKNANFTDEGIRKDIDAGEVTEFVVNGISSENAMEITQREGDFDDGSGVQKGGLTILLDFGGNPANCTVEIFDIAIQKSK